MKIIKFKIIDDCLLQITCKCSWYKSYLQEIEKITEDLKSKDLHYKYLEWRFDIKGNIVFTFRLLDMDKDVKPYIDKIGDSRIDVLIHRMERLIEYLGNKNIGVPRKVRDKAKRIMEGLD